MIDELATAHSSGAVKSADRVLDLFELLGRWDREMSHTEIAAALPIPKSSLTLLLRNLVNRGYIDFSPVTKGYRLGAAFSALARQSGRDFNLIDCVEPVLERITASVGESSALNQLKGQQVEVVATVLGPHRLVSHMRLGDLAPLYATSGGKTILAHLSDELRKEYLSSVKLRRITAKTISSINTLKREIDTVRRNGLAFSFEEFTPGIVGIATVIQVQEGHPLGALSIAMPSVRSTPEVLKRAGLVLQQEAKDIVRQIAKTSSAGYGTDNDKW